MEQIFLSFLLASVVGTVLAGILMLFGPITRKFFSYGWHYYIWLAVLLVMVLPIRLNLPKTSETKLPVFKAVAITDNRTEMTKAQSYHTIIIQENPIQPEDESVVNAVENFLDGKILPISFIWLVGTVLLFVIKIINYLIFLIKIHQYSDIISCNEIKLYTRRKIKTRVSDIICSPLIIGIIRPTLLLPKTDIQKNNYTIFWHMK